MIAQIGDEVVIAVAILAADSLESSLGLYLLWLGKPSHILWVLTVDDVWRQLVKLLLQFRRNGCARRDDDGFVARATSRH